MRDKQHELDEAQRKLIATGISCGDCFPRWGWGSAGEATLCDGDLSQYLPCARVWHRPKRRRQKLPLQFAANAVDQRGADRFRLIAGKLDRDRAEKRIAHRRIDRLRETHNYVEFRIAQAEHGWTPFLRRSRFADAFSYLCGFRGPRPRSPRGRFLLFARLRQIAMRAPRSTPTKTAVSRVLAGVSRRRDRFFEKLRQKSPRSLGKSFVVEAASDDIADHCRRVSLELWGFDPPSILIVTTPLKVIHHVLAHVA